MASGPLDAGPAIRLAPPLRHGNRGLPRGQLYREPASAIEREGAAVEDKLVLAANLIDVEHRKAGFHDARDGDVFALCPLFEREWRAIGHNEEFGAALGEAFGDRIGPDVFANGQAEPDAVEAHRPWHRAGGEVPLLVENAVVRQIGLIAQRLHLAARKQRHGVVDFAVFAPWRAHDHGRGALFRDLGEAAQRIHAGLHEGRLQHQVFGRVSGDEKLRKNKQVRALPARLGPCGTRQPGVAAQVSDYRVKLSAGDAQARCHGAQVSGSRCGEGFIAKTIKAGPRRTQAGTGGKKSRPASASSRKCRKALSGIVSYASAGTFGTPHECRAD